MPARQLQEGSGSSLSRWLKIADREVGVCVKGTRQPASPATACQDEYLVDIGSHHVDDGIPAVVYIR